MSDRLLIYYSHRVVDVYLRFRNTSADDSFGRLRDLGAAVDAMNALFHFREHLPVAMKLSRKAAEARCADYALLGDAANASKHDEIDTETPHGPPLVRRAEDITEQKVFIEYEDAAGKYAMSLKMVFVKLANGGERDLLHVLTNVMNFWEGHLHQHGVLQVKREFPYPDPFRYRTRKECESSSRGIEITQGLPASLLFRFMRFDPQKGTAVPIDLTGADIQFSIYKPKPVEFVLQLKRDLDGFVIERTIALSLEDTSKVNKCRGEEEQSKFLASLPAVRAAMAEMARELKIAPQNKAPELPVQKES